MPGDRRVVRAVFFTLQETGQWLGSWTPWYGSVSLPAGVAYRLPAGAHIVAEIHYRGGGEPVAERGTIGLFFAEPKTPRLAADLRPRAEGAIWPPFDPAPGKRRLSGRRPGLRRTPYMLALRPEITAGLTAIEVSARRPDGSTEILLFARDPPIDWPTPYIFKDPVFLPAGTRLSAIASYASDAAPPPGGFRLTVSRYRK